MVDRTVETLNRIASTLSNIEGLMAEHNALVALDKLTNTPHAHKYRDEMHNIFVAANISDPTTQRTLMHIAKIADSK